MPTRRNTSWRQRKEQRRQERIARSAEASYGVPAPIPYVLPEPTDEYAPPSWYREDVDYVVHGTRTLRPHEVAHAIGLRVHLPNVFLLHGRGDTFRPRGLRPYAHVYHRNRVSDAAHGPTCSDQAVAVDYETGAYDYSAIEARVVANMAQDRVREFDVSTTEAIRNAALRALGSSVSAARILADARAAPPSPGVTISPSGITIRDQQGNVVLQAGDTPNGPAFTLRLPGVNEENLRTALMGSAVPVTPDGTFKWSERIRMTGLPEEGSRPWLRIAKIGCVGKRDSVGEFGCDFAWGCAKCPVTVAKEKAEAKDAPTKLDRFTLRKGRSNG